MMSKDDVDRRRDPAGLVHAFFARPQLGRSVMYNIAFAWVIALGPPVAADAPPTKSARQILIDARDAATRIKSISYEASLVGKGPIQAAFTTTEGTVKAQFAEDDDAHRVLIVGRRKPPKGNVQNFKFAADGKQAFCILEESRRFLSGPAITGRIPERDALLPRGFFGTKAWWSETSAVNVEHAGVEVVSDVKCDVIDIQYDAPGRRRARFYIGQADHLLRKIDRSILAATVAAPRNNDSKIVLSIRNIVIDPAVSDQIFQLRKPDDFTEASLSGSSVRKSPAPPKPLATRPPERRAASPAARSPSGLQMGADAPDWTLADADGKKVSLKDLRGKVVVLDFWASWCGPCRRAMPGVQKIHERHQDKPFAVIGVNCMENGRNANPADLAKNEGAKYLQLLEGNSVAADYGVRALPTFCVIGKDGKVLYQAAGFNPADIEKAIEAGLK